MRKDCVIYILPGLLELGLSFVKIDQKHCQLTSLGQKTIMSQAKIFIKCVKERQDK